MADPALDVFDHRPGRSLVPLPIEVLGREPELHEQVAGEVLRLPLASLLSPKALQGGVIAPHDDAGVGAPNYCRRMRSVSDLSLFIFPPIGCAKARAACGDPMLPGHAMGIRRVGSDRLFT